MTNRKAIINLVLISKKITGGCLEGGESGEGDAGKGKSSPRNRPGGDRKTQTATPSSELGPVKVKTQWKSSEKK